MQINDIIEKDKKKLARYAGQRVERNGPTRQRHLLTNDTEEADSSKILDHDNRSQISKTSTQFPSDAFKDNMSVIDIPAVDILAIDILAMDNLSATREAIVAPAIDNLALGNSSIDAKSSGKPSTDIRSIDIKPLVNPSIVNETPGKLPIADLSLDNTSTDMSAKGHQPIDNRPIDNRAKVGLADDGLTREYVAKDINSTENKAMGTPSKDKNTLVQITKDKFTKDKSTLGATSIDTNAIDFTSLVNLAKAKRTKGKVSREIESLDSLSTAPFTIVDRSIDKMSSVQLNWNQIDFNNCSLDFYGENHRKFLRYIKRRKNEVDKLSFYITRKDANKSEGVTYRYFKSCIIELADDGFFKWELRKVKGIAIYWIMLN